MAVGKFPSRWSYSSLSSLSEQCQRKWVAVRLNGVEDPASKEAVRGTVAHRALEEFAKGEGRTWHDLAEQARLALEWAKEEHAEHYDNGLTRAVHNRIEGAWYLEDWQRVPATHVELELTGVSPAGHRLIGFADRVDEVGGKVYLSDYKSGKWWAQFSGPAIKKQLGLYAALHQQMFGTAAEDLVGRGIYLGSRNIVSVSFTQEDLDEIWQWVDETVAWAHENIDPATVAWPEVDAAPSKLCAWCPLRGVCVDSSVA